MSNLRKYASFSAADAEAEATEVDKFGGGQFLKLKEGRNVLRFLPGTIGTPEKKGVPWAVRVMQHFVELPNDKNFSFVCPRLTAKKPCPACEWVDRLRASGNSVDYDKSKGLIANMRVYANAINRSDPESGVQVVAFGKMVYEALLAIGAAGEDFTDPSENGFDVTIEKSGKGMQTKYNVMPVRKSSPLGNDEWLDQMHDLGRFSNVLPLEEIKKGLGGGASTRGAAAAPSTAVARRSVGRTAADDVIDVEGTEGT